MKKILSFLLMFVFAFSIIACNNTRTDEITIWHDKEEAVIQVLDSFLSEQLPDIKVNFIRKESLTDTLKLVGNSARSAPDMYIFAHDKVGLFAEIGILQEITDYIDIESLDDFVDLTVEAATYKNKIFQLPLYYETLLFMYNKDRMSESEVPETTEDLYNYMVENTDSRRYGFVEQYSNAYYSAGWIHGFNGGILDSDGNPTLNTTEVSQAITYHQKFIEYMPKGQAEYATINTLFLEKKANSIIAGPWLVSLAKERGIDLGFAKMPLIEETGLPISPYAGVQGIHVLKVAGQDEEKSVKIGRILNCLLDPEVGISLAEVSGVAPANLLAYEDESVINNDLVMAMKSAAEDAIPMPNLPQMDVMWNTTSKMLTQIHLNGQAIDAMLSQAQRESEDLIALMQ